MALSPSYKAKIVAALPAKYREAYESGQIDDTLLQAFADRAGILPPKETSSQKPKTTQAEKPAQEADSGLGAFVGNLLFPGYGDTDARKAASEIGESAKAGFNRTTGSIEYASAVGERSGNPADTGSFIVGGLAPAVPVRPAVPTEEARKLAVSRAEASLDKAQSQQKRADEINASINNPFIRKVAMPIADVAGSPSSLASIPGGPMAALPAADAWYQEYAASRRAGLSDRAARDRADAMAAVEAGISAIPTGRVGRIVGKRAIDPVINTAVGNILKTGAKESASEGLTQVAQEGVNSAFTGSEDKAARDYAVSRRSLDLWEDTKRSMAAGFVGGAGVRAATSPFEMAAENGKRAADLYRGDAQNGRVLREQAAQARAEEQAAQQKAKEVDTAYAENTPAAVDNQRLADEQEAAFRTMELRRKAEALLRTNPSNAFAENLKSYTVTPEMIAKEREQDASITKQIADEQLRIKQEEQLAPYKKQADADIKKALEADLKKAQALHQAKRRKVAASYIEEAKALPADTRSEFLAKRLLDWDTANAKPTAESIAPKVKQAETPVPQTPSVKETAPPQQQKQAGMTEEDIRAFGLSVKESGKTGTSSSNILSSLSKQVGASREAAALGKLIADGKLVLVDDASQIPNYTPDMKDSAGYYDGTRMYVAANMIDPANVKGSMLVIAAHESKHAADVSGAGKKGVASIANFIGTDANARLNDKIMKEAADGGAAAEYAVKKTANMSPEIAALELPAYYVSAAMKQRKGAAALGDIVSSIRVKYKSLFNKSDVNLADVGYMANKLVQNLAVTDSSIKGDISKPLSMVVGPEHSEFTKRKSEGRTYVDYDGKEKTLLSDSEATINVDALSSLTKKPYVRFGEIVNAPSIKGYFGGELDAVRVSLNPDLPENSARAVPDQDGMFIELAANAVDVATYDPSRIKDILLHEMQHVIQQVEGFSKGGTPQEFYSKEDLDTFRKQRAAGATVLNYVNNILSVDGEMGSWGLGQAAEQEIRTAVKDYKDGVLTSVEVANTIQALAQESDNLDFKNAAGTFAYAAKLNSVLNSKARDARQKAMDKYERLLGEREAYFTQRNSRLTQEELDSMLRPRYYGEVLVTNPQDNDRTVTAVQGEQTGLSSKADLIEEAKLLIGGKKARFRAKNVIGQFSGFGVLGRALGNIKELADGEAASIAYVAEGDYYRTKFGIRAMAKRRKIALSAAEAEVQKIIDEAAKIEDVARREAYIGRYVAANQELRPLAAALDNIAKQSKAIVAARVKDHRPMTPEEIAKYSSIIKNRYSYFTKTYAAFQGKEGEIRNARLKREATLANSRAAAGRQVPAKYRNAQSIYNRAVEFIANNDVAVFDPEMLTVLPLDRIEYLYSMWVGDPAVLRERILNDKDIKGDAGRKKAFRTAAEMEIAEAGETADPDKIKREAQYVVDGMLGLNEQTNPVISYYRGAKEDRAILESRTVLPEQISELYGEVKDIPTKVAITLAKQGELAARMRMLNTIYETGKGRWFVDKADYKNSPEYEKFSEELNGDEWGPLNGVRVTPEIAAGLNDGLDIFTPLATALAQGHATVDRAAEASSGIAMRSLRKASSLQKFVQIVLSPYNTAVNFLGSGVVLAQNGGARPDDMLRALRASMVLLNNQIAPQGVQDKMLPMTTNPDLELFLKYTLLDSAVGQELRSMPSKFLKQLVTETESATTFAQARQRIHKLAQSSGNMKNFVTEAFALSDAWVKPAVFLSRVRFLENINKAENKGWSKEEIERMAADMTKDTTITFQRAAPVVKLTERLPLTWYATYIQGVFRSVMYSYAQATKDFLEAARAQTPEGQLLYAIEGSKRLSGALAATVGSAMATKLIAAYANDDKEEEYIEGAKKLLYTEGRFGDGIYVGKNDAGDPTFLRLSRLDPNGPVNDMLRILLSDADSSTKERAVIEHIKGLWIMPRTTADVSKLVLSVLSDDPMKNKSTKIERLFPKTVAAFKDLLPADFDTAEAFVQMLDGFVPGVANAFDQEAAAPKDDQDLARKLIGWTMLMTGGRFDVANPGMAAFGAGKRLDTLQKSGRAKVSEAMDMFGPQAAIDTFVDLREQELEAYAKLKDVYDGLLAMGYTPAGASKILKDNKVQAQDIAVIRQGRTPDDFTSLIDEDSLNKLGAIRDSRLTKEARAEAEKARKEAIVKLQLLMKKREDK